MLPVVEYPTRVGGTCSVIGGYVYRGSAIPELTGRYLYSDFCAGWIRSFVLDGGAATDEVELRPAGALFAGSFGFDGSGELYVTTTGGSIYRIDPVR